MARRRVLLLINGVVDTAGGNLRATINIAEALAEDGIDVTLSAPVALGQPHRTVDLMSERVTRRIFRASRPAARFGGSLRQFRWLVRHAKDFDEVQTNSLFTLSAVYSIVICAIHGVPIALWPHGSLDPNDLRKHGWFKRAVGPIVTRRLLDRCSAVVFTVPHEEQIAETYGSTTPHMIVPLPVVPVWTDMDAGVWKSKYGVPRDTPIVLFLGRIDEKKRVPLLVEALSLMERRDAHLVVVGDGPADQTEIFRESIRKFGLEGRVHTTGWVEGQDRAAAFKAADAFALLTQYENFGLAVVEALSVGCPTVISDGVFLAQDLKSARVAAVVEREAPLQAARALDAFLNDPAGALETGLRAKEFVAARYSLGAVGARLRELSAYLDQATALRRAPV